MKDRESSSEKKGGDLPLTHAKKDFLIKGLTTIVHYFGLCLRTGLYDAPLFVCFQLRTN